MFLLVEIDTKNISFGIDWFKFFKGVRLGIVGIHVSKVDFGTFLFATKTTYKGDETWTLL